MRRGDGSGEISGPSREITIVISFCCHAERSEAALTVSALQTPGNDERFFACVPLRFTPLRMTG